MPERAEIEAVCRAWWPMWPKSPNPEGERQRAREAIEALDRVRDARGECLLHSRNLLAEFGAARADDPAAAES